MSYSYLTKDNIFDRYTTAKQYTDSLTDPFPEYSRLAANRPSPNIDKQYPKTTDGTTASIIRKTPHRVIQQVPTGVVKSDTEDWLSVVASFVYTNKIIPSANDEYALITKCWNIVEKAMTYGAYPGYVPFVEHGGYFCTDLTLPFWGDVFFQKGKKSDSDSKFLFMRSWWQPEDIDSLIDREQKLKKAASERGEKYESTWDIKELERVKNMLTAKDDKAMTEAEKKKNGVNDGAIEIITGFQRGVGAEFITFHQNSKAILRVKKNKDPRGEIPLNFMYMDIDGSNPWGRGVVDLVGSLQNLIDGDMQMYQFNRALMLAPPMIKRGNWNKTKAKLAPNVLIDLGVGEGNSLDTLKIDTTAIANYPNLYGLQKSQLLNLMASPDTSISSDVGNPGFSKTPAGINQQESNISVDDNYVRKMFESWFENWSETAINLYFAERSGIEELQLDDDTADQLRKLAAEGKFDIEMLGDDNKITIDYDTATPALKFEVDASTSKIQDDNKQLEALTGLSKVVDGSPTLQQLVPMDKKVGLWNALVSASGVEDPEDLTISDEDIQMMEQQQQAQAEQAQMAQQGMQPQLPEGEQPAEQAGEPQPEMEQELPGDPTSLDGTMQHEQAEPQQFEQQEDMHDPQDTQDEELVQLLQAAGADDTQIQRALAMLQAGYSDQDILQMLGGQGE